MQNFNSESSLRIVRRKRDRLRDDENAHTRRILKQIHELRAAHDEQNRSSAKQRRR